MFILINMLNLDRDLYIYMHNNFSYDRGIYCSAVHIYI